MFCHTLSISTCRVNTALKKVHNRQPLTDQRGLQQGGHNKLPNEKIQTVIDQINKIPRYKSHYCRKTSESAYLPPDMTLVKMYNKYKEEETFPVSFSSYKRIFYDKFNLKFKSLEKDTCNICDRFKISIDNELNNEKRAALQSEHNKHLSLAEDARNLMSQDIEVAKETEEVECLTFDMEKTLPLPRIPTNVIFYKRQLWVYNAGIYSGKENTGYCYIWVEGEAGRGAQEVGSCLKKHIENAVSENVKHLVLWADSCGGQNRNIKLVLMLKVILESSSKAHNLESITLRFLYSGHSFLPNDSYFGDIESALKHHERLYTPEDYMQIMRTCRKKTP